MKVLVLNPPVKGVKFSRDGRCQSEENTWLDTFPPTALISIAGAVREKYNLKLIDCMGSDINYESCLELVKKFNPDFTIVNTSTPTIDTDVEVARRIKEKTNSKIMMYGEHVTSQTHKLFEKYPKIIDFAIRGEPETPIMKVLEGNLKAEGVATLTHDGGVWIEPNLDDLPFPAYDLLPRYKYPLSGEDWMFVRSGRGCPYECIYCVMPLLGARRTRYHSVDYMIKQMKWLANDLNIKTFMFWDELATLNKKRMIELCKKMKGIGLAKKCKWFCTTRVDLFDDELAKYMKMGGCTMITFGVESGSQKVLDFSKKGSTIEQARKSVKIARKHGFKTIGHFILGLPTSTEEDLQKTIDLSKELKLNFVQFYIATPFPGSEFFEMAKKNGWFVEDNWEKIEQGTVAVSYPDLSAETIQKYRRKAYRSFYMRPYAVYSLLTSISPRVLIKLPGYILKFFGWMKK
ncbi:radical SAM protein [archaeon]|jgi:anaerobic magnesium-protoporphyrin IX monomethyl ester cyclase|nr:radical SAM protein [archaeon]MBT4396854.1 radical SAM protein [archaeon]MBT4441468.1 radical SAM protein [archaeon]